MSLFGSVLFSVIFFLLLKEEHGVGRGNVANWEFQVMSFQFITFLYNSWRNKNEIRLLINLSFQSPNGYKH